MEPHQAIKFPLSTEKSIRLMESQNQLLFSVDIAATKEDIKSAVEKLFKVKVTDVRTEISKGNKRALFGNKRKRDVASLKWSPSSAFKRGI